MQLIPLFFHLCFVIVMQRAALGFRLAHFPVGGRRGVKMFHSTAVIEGPQNNYEHITSVHNSKVRFMKSLQLRKKREESQLVLVEGHRMVIDAVNSGAVLSTIMFTQKSLQTPMGEALDEILRSLDKGVMICEVPEHILATVAETVTSQGVIGAFEMPINQKNIAGALQDSRKFDSEPLIVVLDGIRDPGNMGTLIRTTYGLGADAVVAVSGCDVWSSKVLRAATGVQLMSDVQMPVLESDTWKPVHEYLDEENKAGDKAREMQIIVADSSSSADSVPYYEVDFTAPSVIVIGSEATGPSQAAFECPGKIVKVRIPMARTLESFNAGVAGAVLFAEAAKQRQIQTEKEMRRDL